MSEQDKACPFCGCTTINGDSNSLLKWKVCDWCGAEGPAETPDSDPPQGWNIRAADLAQAPAPVRVKPLDLSIVIKHAFLSGVVAARNIDPGDPCIGVALWADYAPSGEAAYARILAALEAPDAGVVAELVEALRKFEAHYPRGINPFLDEAHSKARAIIAKLETRA